LSGRLEEKTIVVTGGASGLGRSHFACGRGRIRTVDEPEDLGAAVLGHDNRTHQYAIQPPSTSRLTPDT
jgi:hypothetical protein